MGAEAALSFRPLLSIFLLLRIQVFFTLRQDLSCTSMTRLEFFRSPGFVLPLGLHSSVHGRCRNKPSAKAESCTRRLGLSLRKVLVKVKFRQLHGTLPPEKSVQFVGLVQHCTQVSS